MLIPLALLNLYYWVKWLMLLDLFDVGQQTRLDLGWNFFSQQFIIIDFMAHFLRFIEDVITKMIDYHLFDVVAEFHSWVSHMGKIDKEIKGIDERQKKSVHYFIPIGSAEEEKLIKKMNKKATGEDTSNKEKVLEEPDITKVEVKQEGNTKIPDEEGEINYEVLNRRYLIVDWESKFYHTDRYGKPHDYYRVFRADGSSRYIKTFTKMVLRFDRLDFIELHSLVIKRFKTLTPEGIDLILWGSLRTMFEANAEDDLWKNQEEWILKSCNFYDNCGVHILVLEDGTEFYMLAERRYPLTKETLKRMLALRLITKSKSEAVFDLLRFIQQQIDESGSHDGSEKDL
ncbi:hypothetical protein Tco_0673451 [Tanacetum coccineum]